MFVNEEINLINQNFRSETIFLLLSTLAETLGLISNEFESKTEREREENGDRT